MGLLNLIKLSKKLGQWLMLKSEKKSQSDSYLCHYHIILPHKNLHKPSFMSNNKKETNKHLLCSETSYQMLRKMMKTTSEMKLSEA